MTPSLFFAKAEELKFYDLPVQSLDASLSSFASINHLQLAYESRLTREKLAIALHGVFTKEQALEALLSNSALSARILPEGLINLYPVPIKGIDAYFAELQTAVTTSVCLSNSPRPGSFRAVVQIWIAATGKVERAKVISSDLTKRQVSRLEGAIDTLKLSELPLKMPQPITVLLENSGEAGGRVCNGG